MEHHQMPTRSIKALRTKKRNSVMQIIAKANIDLAQSLLPEDIDAEYLTAVLKPMVALIRSYDNELLSHPEFPQEEVEVEVDAAEEFNQPISELLARLGLTSQRAFSSVSATDMYRSALQSTPPHSRVRFDPPVEEAEDAETARNPQAHGGATDQTHHHVRFLPRELDIAPEKFNGERIRFRQFRTQFEAYVNRHRAVSDREKLMALLRFLTGEPKRLVDPLVLSDENYAVAWELLESNYSRLDVERDRLLSELRRLGRVSSSFDVDGLRRLLNTVQRNITVLATLDVRIASIAPSVKSSLLAALPDALRQEFKDRQRAKLQLEEQVKALSLGAAPAEQLTPEKPPQKTTAEDPYSKEVRELIDFLKLRVADLEDSKSLDGALNPARSGGDDRCRETLRSRREYLRPRQQTVAATTTRTSKQKFPPRPCLFCETPSHNSSNCPAEISVDRRREVLRQKKRCFRCFRASHADPADCRGNRSACNTCGSRNHYTSMHEGGAQPANPGDSGECVARAVAKASTLIVTIEAYIVNGGSKIPVRLFLDNGSSLTFIKPTIRRMVRENPVQRAKLNIQAFKDCHLIDAERYNIRLGFDGTNEVVELLAYEHDFGAQPENRCSSGTVRALRQFHMEFPLADRSLLELKPPQPPALLVGSDYLNQFLELQAPRRVSKDLLAFKTKAGWTIQGPTSEAPAPRVSVSAITDICCPAALSGPAGLLERWWDLDAIGIKEEDSKPTSSADEHSALDQFSRTVVYDGERYEVAFPKRSSISELMNNKTGAIRRVKGRLNQLQMQPERYRRYDQEIMSFVEEGYASEVHDFNETTGSTADGSYHMPHHAVVTSAGGAEKWRVVFDCSAKERGTTSLNDHLLAGPNLCTDLVTLMLRFRLGRIAVSADITKAYMRIAIAEADRPMFRFLWRRPTESKMRCFQMNRVTWGASSSGFLLAAVLREHFLKSSPEECRDMGTYFYCDDFLRSFDSERDAVQGVDRLRAALQTADMQLAKWKTNSRSVADHLASRGIDEPSLTLDGGNTLKVLGVSWTPSRDTFQFCIRDLAQLAESTRRPTRRTVLSLIASIFDPSGWLTPFTVRGRLIVQRMWTKNMQWEQEVTGELKAEFERWVLEFEALREFQFPRRYVSADKTVTSRELHIFCDASISAYACAAYIQTTLVDGSSEVSLVMSKTKLAPKKRQTLPRLELLGALIATRLKTFIVDNMGVDFDKISFYTDSMIAYFWATARTTGKWKIFVANRVAEIQSRSTADQWFHVPGDQNVADLPTRGISAKSLTTTPSWWSGPAWLTSSIEQRPSTQPRSESQEFKLVQEEIRQIVAVITILSPLLDLERYSTLGRAVRVMTNVLRFTRRAARKPIPLLAELAAEAETTIIRWVQRQYLAKELSEVAAGESVPSASKLAGFCLFADESGVLRARTRLTRGPMFTFDEKNPVIIPGESRLATLLILDTHRVNAHFGVNTVLSFLRRRFWIVRARQVIKAILRGCVVCRRRHSRPSSQIEAPLPRERAEFIAPFAAAGLDFCGPFFARARESTDKIYVALLTCTATRAIHLEVVPFMSTAQTHLALRRFLASYPACRLLITDNARSFTKAATDIKRIFNSVRSAEVRELLESRGIEWKFICPKSPWEGGFYERCVGSVKNALAKTLGRSLISYEEFRTIVTELAAIINERPLTYTSANADELLPLSPAQFLRGGPSRAPLAAILPLDQLGPDGALPGDELRRRLVMRTSYFKNISARWYREYLLQLRSANRTRGTLQRPLEVGEVCLLHEDNVPRVRWNLVRIEDVHTGRDGSVRTYTVRFPNGKVTRRSAPLLYRLELHGTEKSSPSPPESERDETAPEAIK